MKRRDAIKRLRFVLNTYSVTHDANCRGNRSHDKHLKSCNCDTGRAFRHLVRAASSADPQETPQ